ncbi:hypothetical protein [Hymenobacter lapidiphilus]|uniref:Uncharacterized protein n=1 Tax=Hymenobacter lapidiphilus TaxID=2608003 RepID=A0A7Y7U3I0_9BACT|nr:hypothetical protein [Hymenobacter lapidiphilus]NVO29671.1 hypothetical protein [Hymenobacter lapidiphilus]
MATPYEFVANQLLTHFPGASVEPDCEIAVGHRPDFVARTYYSERKEEGVDYNSISLAYPGGYPFYYPLLLVQPGHQPLRIRIAAGDDSIDKFTRPDSEIREYLAHYGYWRIEEHVDSETEDLWVLMLRSGTATPQYLVLPTPKLKQLLNQAPNPEKFSLFIAKAGFCFAAQPLSTANRLALLKDPSSLNTQEYAELNMTPFFNNWQQIASR